MVLEINEEVLVLDIRVLVDVSHITNLDDLGLDEANWDCLEGLFEGFVVQNAFVIFVK